MSISNQNNRDTLLVVKKTMSFIEIKRGQADLAHMQETNEERVGTYTLWDYPCFLLVLVSVCQWLLW